MQTQEKLLDVPVSAAQQEAERYADLAAQVREKAEVLKNIAVIVVQEMKASGQRLLTFKDQYGVTHRFEVVDTAERLKYLKQEPVTGK